MKMKDKNPTWRIILAASLIVMLAESVGAATYYMTVSSVTITSSNPHEKDMYSLTLSVTYSAPSGVTVSDCKARVSSLPTGWRVRDDYTGSNYKTLATCSGTTTFDIMPVSIGTLPASMIVVEVKGADQSGENTVNVGTGSPSGTITVKYQPVLDLTLTNISSAIIASNQTTEIEYRVRNTGTSYSADTENLRLLLTSDPANAVTFDDNTTSKLVGIGILAPSGTSTGTATLKPTMLAPSNSTINVTITATSDNTLQKSSASQALLCTTCGAGNQIIVSLLSGWNLISISLGF